MNRFALMLLPVALLAAADQPWKDKQVAQWSPEDAKQVLTDSPWARQTTLTISDKAKDTERRNGRSGGRRGGIGMGIPGIGGVGMPGGGGRRGGGYPGGGSPRGGGGGYPPQGGDQDRGYPRPETEADREGRQVTVRWESALPVQEAHLKTKDADAPSVDESHYAIVVGVLPGGRASRSQLTEKDLKEHAELKKEGKKFAKPSEVKVLSRDEGYWVIYYFPRSKELTAKDTQVDFEARLGRFELTQTFYVQDMTFHGKLEL